MLAFVFVVAIGNFALGFAAYSMWQRRLEVRWPFLPSWPAWLRWPKSAAPIEAATEPVQAPVALGQVEDISSLALARELPTRAAAAAVVFEEVAQKWLERLGNEAVGSRSFVEAAVETFRLEVGCYRHDLLEIDDRLRAAVASSDLAELNAILVRLEEVNGLWLAKQNSAADLLRNRHGNLGKFEATGEVLHEILVHQASQIESTRGSLQALDLQDDIAGGCFKAIREMCRLLDLAHALRDGLQDSMAVVLRSESRLGDIERRLHFDRDGGMYTRLGLEVLLSDWRRDDPGGSRLVSVVLIDLDRCGLLNELYGVKKVDRLLDAFSGQLATLIRKDRGFDRMARLGGQTFLAFLGDTGPRQATSAAERIRQSIQAMTFELCRGEFDARAFEATTGDAESNNPELELATTMAVVEVGKRDDVSTLLASLRTGLSLAKQAGRNRTFLDEGQGYLPVEPPIYQVKARIVSVPFEESLAPT